MGQNQFNVGRRLRERGQLTFGGETLIFQSDPYSVSKQCERQVVYQNSAAFLPLFLVFCQSTVAPSDKAFGRHLDLIQRPNQQRRDAGSKADDEKEARPLEPDKPIKRELAGANSQTYQIRLSAGQFLKAIVEQQGIDVVVQVSGPDGKHILGFDSESMSQGQEEVSLVAEVEGAFQLIVRPTQIGAPAGSYEIRIEELRVATETDRALLGQS